MHVEYDNKITRLELKQNLHRQQQQQANDNIISTYKLQEPKNSDPQSSIYYNKNKIKNQITQSLLARLMAAILYIYSSTYIWFGCCFMGGAIAVQ